MVHTPQERTNRGDFYTHRQIKIKEKLTKTPTNLDMGKTRNKKTRKRIEQNWSLEFFSRTNTFQANLTNKTTTSENSDNYKILWISKQ